MSIFFKMMLRTICYVLIAFVFFLYFVNLIQFPEKKVKTSEDKPMTTEEITKKAQFELKEITKIQEAHDNAIICQYTKNKACSTTIQENKNKPSVNYLNEFIKTFVFFDYIQSDKDNDKAVISAIYIIILFTFLLQTSLYAWSYYYQELLTITSKEKLDRLFLYTSEWTVNSPPVLGVIGTIFSLGVLVANLVDAGNLTMLFKTNFAKAALTTIIGGSVFILNLFMNIFTTKNLTMGKKTHNWLDMSKL